ncbi:hypothetical protein FPV67DRAFT_338410 [Lyophyllum atratum]|nr:hypothetical protein FPV67DRAFT_338410 [Lyophyllum atratum]
MYQFNYFMLLNYCPTVAPSLAPQGSGSNTRLPPADAQHAPDPDPIPTAPTPTISVIEHTATPTPASVPFPTTAEPTPTSTPRKSSWFGSLSRAKGKQNAAKLNIKTSSSSEQLSTSQPQHDAPLASTSVPSYTTQPMVESPTSTSPPPLTPTSAASPSSRPLPIPAAFPAPATSIASTSVSPTPAPAPTDFPPPQPQTPVRRSWFTSSPSPAPRPELHGPQTSASNSIPSSIDEEVPALSVVTPPSSSPPTSPSIISSPSTQSNGGTGRARLSSLNPSTSRFTLSIPLLGRAKMPLETAVAVAQSEEAKNGTS